MTDVANNFLKNLNTHWDTYFRTVIHDPSQDLEKYLKLNKIKSGRQIEKIRKKWIFNKEAEIYNDFTNPAN